MSKHSAYEMALKHGSHAIGEEWVDNGIRWKIGSSGELLCYNIIRRADSVSFHIWSTVNMCIYCSYFSLLLLNALSTL